MQVLLHADHHTDGSQPMAEHLTRVVKDALDRFGERVTRVEAHLSDADGTSRTGTSDIHCTLQASVVGADPVIVKDQAPSAHQAIEGALRKLKRAVGASMARQDPRRPSRRMAEPATEAPGPGMA